MLRDRETHHLEIGWGLIDGNVWRRPTGRLYRKTDHRGSGSEDNQPLPVRSSSHCAKVRADRREPLSYGQGKTTTLRVGGQRRAAGRFGLSRSSGLSRAQTKERNQTNEISRPRPAHGNGRGRSTRVESSVSALTHAPRPHSFTLRFSQKGSSIGLL